MTNPQLAPGTTGVFREVYNLKGVCFAAGTPWTIIACGREIMAPSMVSACAVRAVSVQGVEYEWILEAADLLAHSTLTPAKVDGELESKTCTICGHDVTGPRPAPMAPKKLRGEQDQSCKRCGAVDGQNFNVPDELWKAVAGPEWCNERFDSGLCLACFDDLATAKGVSYIDRVTNLLFVGRQVCCDFVMTKYTDESGNHSVPAIPDIGQWPWEQRAKNEALEEAAKVADKWKNPVIAAAIRALKTTSPATDSDLPTLLDMKGSLVAPPSAAPGPGQEPQAMETKELPDEAGMWWFEWPSGWLPTKIILYDGHPRESKTAMPVAKGRWVRALNPDEIGAMMAGKDQTIGQLESEVELGEMETQFNASDSAIAAAAVKFKEACRSHKFVRIYKKALFAAIDAAAQGESEQ